VEAVSEAALAWIAKHREAPEAQFVYNAWLNAGGGVEAVSEAALAWIAKHREAPEAGFVYNAWLNAGGEKSLILPHLFAWLHAWRDLARAVYLTKPISQLNDLPDAVLLDLAHWSAQHRENEDAIFRVSRISRYLAREQTGDATYANILRSGWIVLLALRRRGLPDDTDVRFAVGMLLNNMALGQNHSEWGVWIVDLISCFLADGKVFCRDLKVDPHPYFFYAIITGMRAGMLRVQRDALGLGIFADWLRSRPDLIGNHAAFLTWLGREFPDGPWG
jgi:hypothetical protein